MLASVLRGLPLIIFLLFSKVPIDSNEHSWSVAREQSLQKDILQIRKVAFYLFSCMAYRFAWPTVYHFHYAHSVNYVP